MIRNTIRLPDGDIVTSQATPIKWGNSNIAISTGLTRQQFIDRKQAELTRIASNAPWQYVNKFTRVRNAIEALQMLASDHYDSSCVAGITALHHSLTGEIPVNIADECNATQWDIAEGDPFKVLSNFHAFSGKKSDDSPSQNWPTEVNSITIGGIWGFFWKPGMLAHSRYSCVASIISAESCHSLTVRLETMKQMSDLTNLKQLVFWSNVDACWICIPKHTNGCGYDWVFETSVCGVLGHMSTYCLHGISEIINGEPQAIPFEISKLTEIFLADIDPANYDIDLAVWKLNCHSGYVLTTPEIYDRYVEIANEKFSEKLEQARLKKKLHKFTDDKYVQQIRNEIAKTAKIYVNNTSQYTWRYNLSTDYFHAFDAYIFHLVQILGLTIHVVNRFAPQDSISCIQGMHINFVTKSYEKYIANNHNRSIKKDWNFTSNGHGYKMICAQIGFAQNEAAWKEHHKIDNALENVSVDDIINGEYADIDMSLFIGTLKLAAQYTAHKFLRRGWSGIVRSTTTSQSIQDTKYYWRKGFNILRKFGEEAVKCLIFCIFDVQCLFL